MSNTFKLPFCHERIDILDINDTQLVPVRPICEDIGLQWAGQLKVIKGDPILSRHIQMQYILSKDNKNHEMSCLPLTYLYGWGFRVNARRYGGDKKRNLIAYQEECYEVLKNHFSKE